MSAVGRIGSRLQIACDRRGKDAVRVGALAEKLGIADRIHWLGHVPEPIPILQGRDAFLMVSMGEAFGLALAEAMAYGTTVVAPRSGALSEILEDGKSGLLLPPRDVSALADAIEKLARDEEQRRRLARRGRERVHRHYTVGLD